MEKIAIATEHLPTPSETQQTTNAGQYLTFMLKKEIYALNILHVKEIIEYGDLTEVPMMPAFVRGVINLRGSVVPVIDLETRFGKGSTTIAKRTGIVIVETLSDEGQQDIGVIVDAVNEVIDVSAQEIEPPPSFGSNIRPDFISGMAKRNSGFVILLNVNRVLSIDEMTDLSKATANSF